MFRKLILISFFLSHYGVADNNLYKQEPALYSYIIGSLNNKKIEAEDNSEIYTIPASCLKVVTSLLAYKVLGSEFSYQTVLYKSKDDYVIRFSGDPSLTSEKLKQLLEPLKGQKFDRLILDNSLFIIHPHSVNNVIADKGTKNSRPISAMVIDKNFIHLKITPSNAENDAGYQINSELSTGEEPTSVVALWDKDVIKLKGSVNNKSKIINKIISPININDFAMYKVINILQSLNISATIEIVDDEINIPEDKVFIGSIVSDNIGKIIPPALESSDNMIFDILYLNILHKVQDKKIQDWGEGNIIIKKLIKEYLDVDVEKSIIVDGSGLSFYNRIKPRQLFEILRKNYSILVDSMPSSQYINNSWLGDKDILNEYIRAKTGSLLGFRCLCGYNTREDNPKAFVIMANSFEPLSQNINSVIAKFIEKR